MNTPVTSYSKNKKAFHDYIIIDTFEAGIVLNGDEVKSIKASQANLKGAFIDIQKEEAYVNEMHVSATIIPQISPTTPPASGK